MKKDLAEKLSNQQGPKRILSLDGGGIRGILTLGYLLKVEKILRERYHNPTLVLSDYYDLIGGTSTGAIIASCLALGKPVQEIINLYKNFGKEVFGNRVWPIIPRSFTTIRSFLKSTYKSSVLEAKLKEQLGDTCIGDTEKIKCGLAIMAKRADTYSLWTVANHPNGIYYEANKGQKLWELCRASSAAPYYFSPKKIKLKRRNGESFDAAFIDGGVSLANNPAFQLFLTCTIPSFGFNWNLGEKNIFISSFGTGNGVKKQKVNEISNRRTISWAPEISELFMTDALEMNQAIMQLFGKNYGPLEFIDSQYQDLKDVNYITERIFSFTRFNVKITQDVLKGFGINKSQREVNSLVQMDHFENIDTLLEIGKKAALEVMEENFPKAFDI
ncbi:patatin-like phospholipase family protein [Hymenobacter sp. GOD-10R]|uniref:patatin-like phospholipase family protein n=1 Tax=Hymenobacter sp. GOD-10R TaxID=3093922 RepID=UPI002D7814E8|nr:patatin-like phospholipase family protein [Hymenobacter sp. GOD-10R]WRQ28141.1 patatin-like phospholipase family protein [Hymenobacter sp. GOD-10R]